MPPAYRIADIAHRSFVSALAGVTVYGTFTLLSGYSNHKKMRLEALEQHEHELSLKDGKDSGLRVDEQKIQ